VFLSTLLKLFSVMEEEQLKFTESILQNELDQSLSFSLLF
jgi:hypothetical protein